jgi:multiple sugar transport system substrate-binding protein
MHSRTAAEGTKPEAGIKVLMDQNPKVTIKFEPIPGDDYYTKILALAAGGQLGDTLWGSIRNYQFLCQSGLYLDEQPLVQAKKYDTTQFLKASMDFILQEDGKLWALPYKAHPGCPAIYYNKEMFDKAGTPAPSPKSYTDLAELAAKMTKDTNGDGKIDQWGFLLHTEAENLITSTIRSWGVEPVEPVFRATKSLMDQPKQIEAVTWIWEIYNKYKACPLPGPGTQGAQPVFIAGQAAMRQASSSTKGDKPAIGDKFTMLNVLMPPGPGGVVGTQLNFDTFAISAKTKYPEEAFDVVGYFCGKEHGIRLGLPEGGGSWTCGARKDVFFSDELMKDPNHKIFADIIEKSQPMWYAANYRMDEWWTALQQGLDKILLNPKAPTVDDFRSLKDTLQNILNKAKS